MSHLPQGAQLRPGFPPLRRARRRRPGENLTIWQALPAVELAFLCWGTIRCCWTHWTGLRTIGCISAPRGCLYCFDQLPRPKWYLGAYSLQHGEKRRQTPGRCVAELTLAARRGCPDLAAPPADFWGRRLLLGRLDRKAKSEAYARLKPVDAEGLPAGRPVEPRQVLRCVWTEGPGALTVDQVDLALDLAAAWEAAQGGEL